MTRITEVPRWFTNRMKAKLIQNSDKDPDNVGHADFWIIKLHEEVAELRRAIDRREGFQRILDEAADVANIAMLIARWYKP